MAQRNRAAGWQYAKLSGHSNEARVKELLDGNPTYGKEFMTRLGLPAESIVSTSIGGLHETEVPGVLGKKTKSKTDLKIKCSSGRDINISIKKSLGGQVYYVKPGLFIEVFEKQFHKSIPADVQRAIKLFWAAADDALSIIEQYANREDAKSYNLQVRHRSLNATTLKKYDANLYHAMLQWFKENAYELAKLSFSLGAASDPSEWSDYVWYINTLEEDKNDIDEIFSIEDICSAAAKLSDSETFFGDKNGGTTIQLPFGFVEWHHGQLQFHHKYDAVRNLIDNL